MVVISPQLGPPADCRLVNKLWELRATTEARLELVPCGEREWADDHSRPILEIARREGMITMAC